jgi:hypothetical protein
MKLVLTRSLGATIDAIDEALFFGKRIPRDEAKQAALWISSRQGQPGSYAEMPAPMKSDFQRGVRFFTGEGINSGAGVGHVLGEEACRALLKLGYKAKPVQEALALASAGLMARLAEHYPKASGTYCCGSCSVAYWRHLAAGGLDLQEQRLANGLKHLKGRRDGKGRWQGFPFYYTLLALNEMELPGAINEIRYAAPACARALKRKPAASKYGKRRQELLGRILGRI